MLYRELASDIINQYPSLLKQPGARFTTDVGGDSYRILHEIGHSIDFWLRNKHHRLLLDNYGYNSSKIGILSIKDCLIEARVLLISKIIADKLNIDIRWAFSPPCPGNGYAQIQNKNYAIEIVSNICNSLYSLKDHKIKQSIPDIELHVERILNELLELDLLSIWKEICTWYLKQKSPWHGRVRHHAGLDGVYIENFNDWKMRFDRMHTKFREMRKNPQKLIILGDTLTNNSNMLT